MPKVAAASPADANAATATSAAAQIDRMLADFAAMGDPEIAERAEDLVRTLVEFYDGGLGRLVDLLTDRADGEELLRELATDKIVSGLLILHDLHPATTLERVAAALERVRPYLGSHAGDVDLLGVDEDGVVRLRLAGSCNGCPSSSVTVKLAIEQAIEEVAPEVVRVEVEGVAAPPLPRGVGGPGGRTMLPMLGAPPTPAQASPSAPASAWIELADLPEIGPGMLAAATVGGSGNALANTMVANLEGGLYAYRNRCPGCGAPLHNGVLVGDVLTCPGCAQRFDLRRAGVNTVRFDLHLEPMPLLAEEGTVRVAVPVSLMPAGAR